MTLNASQDIRDALDAMDSSESQESVVSIHSDDGELLIEEIVETRSSSTRSALLQCTIDRAGKTSQPSSADKSSVSTWKKRPPGKKTTSKVWDYFSYDPTTEHSECKVAGCTTGAIKGKNASNLKKHLQHAHPQEFIIVNSSDTAPKTQVVQMSNKIEIPKGQMRLSFNGTLENRKYDKSEPKQAKWRRQMTILFGANPIPNYLIQNEDFQKSYEIADPKLVIPCRRTLEKSIDQLMAEVKLIIIDKLSMARRITLSSDIWTKKGMTGSYLGVMATIYDGAEEKKLNLVLSVRKFKEIRHTASNIYDEMQNVLKEYTSSEKKVWKMITDSGSNMVCAFRDQVFALQEDPDEFQFEDFYNSEQDEEDIAEVRTPTYGRLSCFIHSLLLSLKKFEAGKVFDNLVTKVKLLVSKFSSSQVLTGELIRLSGLKLLSFSNTRWNITFLVVQRLILVKHSVVMVLEKYEKSKYNLSDSEWNLLSGVQEYLAPFNKFTDMSSTEGTRALSEVVMILKQLETHLNKYTTIKPFITVSKEILKNVKERFGHFYSETASKPLEGIYLTSTMLDPPYRIGLTSTERELAKRYILTSDWEWDTGTKTDELNEPNKPSNTEGEVAKKKRKFEFLETLNDKRSNNNKDLTNEVKLYMESEVFDTDDDKYDPWKFWNRHKATFPKLSEIALEVLSIPLSIGHVERIFSFAGFATGGRRNRLDGEHLEREVFLNKNKHVLKIS